MPLIEPSGYRPPFLLRSGHLQTVWPTLFRRVADSPCRRERLELPDGDFLDLDWSQGEGRTALAVLSHGMEGDGRRWYVRAMGQVLNRAGYDTLAWTMRGCGPEPNRLPRFYHAGAVEDLDAVVGRASREGKYEKIALVGFSLGGNLLLKYLGERGTRFPGPVAAGVAVSPPCDLAAAVNRIHAPANRVYLKRFMRSFRRKIRGKAALYPRAVSVDGLEGVRDLRSFDNRYTAPLNGFRDAEDYWRRASALPVLPGIEVPTLILSAQDDPFLPEECFPSAVAAASPCLFLEAPRHGGHVGFMEMGKTGGGYWSERRAAAFLREVCR